MEPVVELFVPLVVPALLGGLFFAGVMLFWARRHPHARATVARSTAPLGVDAINMAHIRVDGIGGLGLVAMALGIAIAIPRIGETVGLGLVLGAGLAALWIAKRREAGPMPSSGQRKGAHSLFFIDTADQERPSGVSVSRPDIQEYLAVPAGTRL